MGWAIVKTALMKIAGKVLEGVIAKLITQNGLVDNVIDQIGKYLTDLLVVWEGDDSQKTFVDEVRRELVPELQQLARVF